MFWYPLLAGYFLEENRARLGLRSLRLSPEAQKALLGHDWPGNVRELEHLIGRASIKALARHGERPRILSLDVQDLDLPSSEASAAVEAVLASGEPQAQWPIIEDGLHYLLDLGSKQNSGLFLDMRLGRQWVREQAAGKRVLNLFAYTCGFSVAAIAGGAAHVVNLDMARAALSRGRDNHRLNGHDLSRVEFLGHELFKSWGKVRKSGPYNLVIIDPPSFQKGSFALTQDYAKILRRLPELLTEHGTVLACVNDPDIGPDFIIDGMATEAPQLRFVERLDNPPEFPDISPESGLKALVFQQG